MNMQIEEKIKIMLPLLDERQKRIYLATEAQAIGRGGISAVSRISGVSRVTINEGIKELKGKPKDLSEKERCRRKGGGRKKSKDENPKLLETIEELIKPHTSGDPESPLLWTSKSVRKIEEALKEKGINISYRTISDLLKELGYSLQKNRKDLAIKASHPDRNAQFEYINDQAKQFIKENEPVISIDAKKKENIGNFENKGAEYQKIKEPEKVLDHDFPIKENGKAVPYGVYDIALNKGFVNVGISCDTAEFSTNSILKWWDIVGSKYYPNATKIMITADCGGSNGNRLRLWKVKLQEVANKLNKIIYVTHFPPGTSKWNKIEHRLFSHISINWRGKPLTELMTVINLIASTTTTTGLSVECVADTQEYQKGIEVTDEQLNTVKLLPHEFHGEWNYEIHPNV